ncbi:hypothetical protein A8F94_17680 [Bacillus sp. FJAT-27225]|uniref:NETI motif-containing protein n=1 Tax=Bacillus sp. FJAT-27225 TaxID=1743144 RepID=UPI00080C32AC|nr:NETI motif-containing protein [Bacillus sp. FJAT-27225]OCA82978.1 hypothetical protein A8F94_17680 [Bacillus sp. FJAT-27225]
MGKKQMFEVLENESIDECLNRMKAQGFRPVRRIEKPIFKEEGSDIVPAGRQIVFEGKPLDNE